MKSRLIAVCIFFSLFSFSAGADLGDARDAMARGDFEAAAREYTRLAEAGDASAQAHLGYMYYTGEGVEQDYTKAVEWYRKAAEQGNADAQYNLAVAYAFGEGVEQDYRQAANWYRQAADQGHAIAQYSLGLSYTYGEGVEQDYDAARRWFGMAADQDYAAAEEALNSLEEYLAAMDKQAEQKESVSEANTSKSNILSMEGMEPALPRDQQQPGEELLATQIPTTQIDEPERVPEPDGAEEEDAVTQTDAGDATEAVTSAIEDESNTADAAAPVAAAATTATAGGAAITDQEKKQSFLERLFGSDEEEEGSAETEAPAAGPTETVAKPRREAIETEAVMPAAETETPEPASDTVAMTTNKEAEEESFLDRLFDGPDESATSEETDTGETKTGARSFDPVLYEKGMNALDSGDYGSAVNILRESAGQGDPRAQYRLGSLHHQGLGVSQSYSEAVRWYRRAADGGNADAQYSLGNMYFMGEGVEQDDSRAGYWYEKAAEQGHISARHNLSNLKRVMKRAGEPHKVLEGKEEKKEKSGNEESTSKSKQKRGLFDRLFGDDENQVKTAADDVQNGPVTEKQGLENMDETQANSEDSRKSDSVLHKDSGGLFGYLFGNDDNDNNEPSDEQAETEETADAQVDNGSRKSDSVLHKDSGGLFGFLFGNDDDDNNEPPDEQAGTEETADAQVDNGSRKSDSVLHKDSGGLFGYLFGDDDEETQGNAGQATEQTQSDKQSRNTTAAETGTDPEIRRKTVIPDSAVEDYRKGMARAFGDGVAKSEKEAFQYFRRSAEAGFIPAQYQLAVAYAYGKGTGQDKQQAAEWYKRAATQGHSLAQRNLGLMYQQGEGVEQDKIRALAWYSIVAQSGNAMDLHRRDILIRELSPEQITESQYIQATLRTEIETAVR